MLWFAKIDLPYWLSALKMFPYFMAGHYFFDFNLLENLKAKCNIVTTLCIVMYVGMLYYTVATGFHFLNLTGIFAIVLLVVFFNNNENRLPAYLIAIGRKSLQIYVLHWFFLPSLKDLGEYLTVFPSFNSNFIVTLLICAVLGLPIIFMCICVAKIICLSEVLNLLCFGEQNRKSK